MAKNKLPKLLVKWKNNQGVLFIKTKKKQKMAFAADEIFERRLFDSGKKIAIIFKKNEKIGFAVIGVHGKDRTPKSEIYLSPDPQPGYVIALRVKTQEVYATVHFQSCGKFYMINSRNMKILGPMQEDVAGELLESRT
ncbi:MAG: hypothetical protein WC459_03405 [Patescibacteria group bacterium]